MNYCIRFVDLPCSIKGLTLPDADGFYSVYINARLSEIEQKKAIQHEMCHIARNDCYSDDKPLGLVESM